MLEFAGRKLNGALFRLKVTLGLARTLDTDDRQVLEHQIFPRLRRGDCQRILFVGCEWYTRCYNEVFADREYWTLELDPEKAQFGSARHVVDSIENLDRHFEPGYFDAIVCNGVFGWASTTATPSNAPSTPASAASGRADCS